MGFNHCKKLVLWEVILNLLLLPFFKCRFWKLICGQWWCCRSIRESIIGFRHVLAERISRTRDSFRVPHTVAMFPAVNLVYIVVVFARTSHHLISRMIAAVRMKGLKALLNCALDTRAAWSIADRADEAIPFSIQLAKIRRPLRVYVQSQFNSVHDTDRVNPFAWEKKTEQIEIRNLCGKK